MYLRKFLKDKEWLTFDEACNNKWRNKDNHNINNLYNFSHTLSPLDI